MPTRMGILEILLKVMISVKNYDLSIIKSDTTVGVKKTYSRLLFNSCYNNHVFRGQGCNFLIQSISDKKRLIAYAEKSSFSI